MLPRYLPAPVRLLSVGGLLFLAACNPAPADTQAQKILGGEEELEQIESGSHLETYGGGPLSVDEGDPVWTPGPRSIPSGYEPIPAGISPDFITLCGTTRRLIDPFLTGYELPACEKVSPFPGAVLARSGIPRLWQGGFGSDDILDKGCGPTAYAMAAEAMGLSPDIRDLYDFIVGGRTGTDFGKIEQQAISDGIYGGTLVDPTFEQIESEIYGGNLLVAHIKLFGNDEPELPCLDRCPEYGHYELIAGIWRSPDNYSPDDPHSYGLIYNDPGFQSNGENLIVTWAQFERSQEYGIDGNDTFGDCIVITEP